MKKNDGSVVSWGYPEYGGDSSYVKSLLRDVSFVSSNSLYKSGPVRWHGKHHKADATNISKETTRKLQQEG